MVKDIDLDKLKYRKFDGFHKIVSLTLFPFSPFGAPCKARHGPGASLDVRNSRRLLSFTLDKIDKIEGTDSEFNLGASVQPVI